MILFDLKQIKEKLIQTNHTIDNNNVNTDMLKIINPTNADNKLHDIKDKTPCFSKQMSKDIKVAGRKLVYKENEQTRTNMHEDNKNIIGNNCTNNETRNNTNNNLPKTKSTKLKDIKTFASRYRSPSPIITKKTKQVHTNHNFVKMKSDSNLFNIVVGPVPFTPVKNDNKSNINFSKPKSNNQKTPKVNNNNNHSPITSLHWLP